MRDLTDFRAELLAVDEPNTSDEYRTTVFVERVCGRLSAGEVIEGVELCQWQGTVNRRRAAVSAAVFHPQDGSASLVLAHYDGTDGEPPVLSAAEVGKSFKLLTTFLDASFSDSLAGIDEKAPSVFQLMTGLRERRATISKLRLFLITDARLSDRVRELPQESVATIPCELHIWDVARLAELASTGHEALEIDLDTDFAPIPCLPAHLPTGDYQSYLCVVPAAVLADLYGRYGARLLETNVRGFLSDRGKVNRGIRATIQNRSQMFFAYNNGLTATASSVNTVAGDGGERLVRISDLQIVNGGQTTASLFWARKKHKASLNGVFVQMKLSVIPASQVTQLDQVVSDISRFANSQNKVSDADLFANHPFHREMERISRRTSAPSPTGGQFQTYWFYERARAQYENERSGLTPAKRKEFDEKWPKEQCITKTDFAHFVNAWDQAPESVSRGAQKSFKRFADLVAARWEKNPDQFSQVYYKRAVAAAILFKALERLVQRQPWYSAFRAQIAAYTMATLSDSIDRDGKKLNLLAIWGAQRLTSEVESALVKLAKTVWDGLSTHPDRALRPQWGNLGEWFKAEQCWGAARHLGILPPAEFRSLLISVSQYDAQDAAGAKSQKIDTGIDAQIEALKLRLDGYWQRLKDWNHEDPVLSEPEFEAVIRVIAQSRPPSEVESRTLMQAKRRAETNGFLFK